MKTLRTTLEKIAAYPTHVADELSAGAMRGLAREALCLDVPVYEVQSIQYMAGELTLKTTGEGRVPQHLAAGHMVSLEIQ